ncbi:MAG: methionyl-tRNA formyltransferase [Acidimicrobiales bacterium]
MTDSQALPFPPSLPKRLVYFGTPEAAVAPLQALVVAGFDVALVVSRADRRRGRRAEPTPSPVKAAAIELGIAVTTEVEDALAVNADCGVVVAYGRLIQEHVLRQLPMINVHFSLLPRWRGAAPVERALLAGDTETGVGIMALDVTLDTGAIFAEHVIEIGAEETADELRARLVVIGAELLVATLQQGLTDPTSQVGEPTYAAKIRRDDLKLDFNSTAAQILQMVRVGGSWTTFRDRTLKIHAMSATDLSLVSNLAPGQIVQADGRLLVGTNTNEVELRTVQPEAKPRVEANAWANGARLTSDDRLGQ